MHHVYNFNLAKQILKKAIAARYAAATLITGKTLTAQLGVPNKLADMKASFDAPVPYYGVDSTNLRGVMGETTNAQFRFIHDYTHVVYGLDTGAVSECLVHAEMWADLTFTYVFSSLTEHANALLLYTIDTYGQTWYYDKFKKFVVDQPTYVEKHFKALHGLSLRDKQEAICRIQAGTVILKDA